MASNKSYGVSSDVVGKAVVYFDSVTRKQKREVLTESMTDVKILMLLRNGVHSSHFTIERDGAKFPKTGRVQVFKRSTKVVALGTKPLSIVSQTTNNDRIVLLSEKKVPYTDAKAIVEAYSRGEYAEKLIIKHSKKLGIEATKEAAQELLK